MKKHLKNSLPGKVSKRVAQHYKLSKNKSRVRTKGFRRLAIIFSLLIFLSGYYPTLTFPPGKISYAQASNLEQKAEIVSSSFPQPPMLPHPGYLSTRFSKYHPGIDIAAGLGMPIHPINPGVVQEIGRDFWGLGNYMVVAHENGFKSTYGHMGKIYVKKGDRLSVENILGEVGITGKTSGPHTHLEITYNETPIDPQTILPEIPDMPASQRGEPKDSTQLKK